MKAIQLHTFEGVSALIELDVPRPIPANNEVLVRVHGVGVTPSEMQWYTTSHTKSGARREHAIPGHEFSGVITDVGAAVVGISIGDEIYGMNDWFADGGAAEYCLTEPANIAPKPRTLTHAMAASVPISALTAWQALFDHAKLKSGEKILVLGGTGGVGLFGVQLAHARGAVVSSTVSSLNLQFVRQLGADEALDYSASPFEGRSQEFDVIFDTVGGETLAKSWSLLKDSGRMVTIATESEGTGDLRTKNAFFIVETKSDQLVEIARLLDSGSLMAMVNAVVPFEEGPAAFDGQITEKRGIGKVVVSVLPD
ncbi:NADP-dependent oxidoreductase [Acidicapsa ligni]|uniref:NADP-dependent oxidoreductase n=1 Tax=Acidicapsa ligni TaxID=542300 RepID=UPI0021DF9DDE|nr:NADP-dependent oxidoreductase [Acidicapsa ligni]